MSKFRHAGLLSNSVWNVSSTQLCGKVLRRESSTVDGVTFYRFTLNPGLKGQFQTFWAEDVVTLYRAVKRRAEK